MIHHYVQTPPDSSHWGVNTNGYGRVLAQLADARDQLRLGLTPDQAEAMAAELLAAAATARQQAPFVPPTASVAPAPASAPS